MENSGTKDTGTEIDGAENTGAENAGTENSGADNHRAEIGDFQNINKIDDNKNNGILNACKSAF